MKMALARRIDGIEARHTRTIGFLLYLFLIPPLVSVVLAILKLDIKAFFLNLVAFLLFFGALHFSKKGFAAEFEYKMANFAKAPKPYKLMGALLLGLATFYSAFVLSGLGLFESLFMAFIAVAGYYLWYGFDPREDKIPDTGDMGSEVAYETLRQARERLRETKELLPKIKNYDLRRRVETTLHKAEEILKELDKKPAYVRQLRKFLVVYIDGVHDVTKSYLETQEEIGESLKAQLMRLMDEVERRFERELERVRASGAERLDTKIKTLDRQIKEQ